MAVLTSNGGAKMKDVAERAGVSIKTVSRVLNNEPHVQDKLRRKVREAVDELNYVPSQSARSLRGNRSYDINLICHQKDSTYVNRIQFGAAVACQELGYQLSISLLEDLSEKPISAIRSAFEGLLRHRRPDGFLLCSSYASDEKIDFVLQELGIPAVRVGPIDIPNQGILVEIDDSKASIEMTRHLIDLGHKRIGFVKGNKAQQATHIRYSGFRLAMDSAGLEVDPELVVQGDFLFDSGYQAGLKFLALDNRPTAIFASNDDMAAGIVTAFREHGVKIPEDVSIVGFDDATVATCMRPLLTTIRQPLDELGDSAVRELIGQLNQKGTVEPRRIVLDYELVVRDTTKRLEP